MDIFHASEYLVYQELYMFIRKLLCLNNVIQIGSHQMGNQINIVEAVQRLGWCKHINKADNLQNT